MNKLAVKVNRIRAEARDIKSFELVSTNGALPGFAAGSHIDVEIAPGMTRQYSLCNGPDDNGRYLIAVKREPESRGGSRAMHERIREGDSLTISAPRNNFAVESGAGHHLLLAGGIGVTPILSMARHLLAARASFDVHYFSRSLEHTAFRDVLADPAFKGKVNFHYALEPDGLRAYLRKLLWFRAPDAHVYLCGPRPFMDLVEATAAATWPPESVHLEYFVADPRSLAGAQDEFQVTLARSGGTYTIASGCTIVEALGGHGIRIETSCEQGMCGTCLTGVLQGTPDHRDVFLSDAEKQANDRMTPCVSRARTPHLVLDL